MILACASYVPSRVLTNRDLSRSVDTSDEWISSRTGIRERRIAAHGELSSDMALVAARRALARSGHSPEDLALIVVATISADQQLPSCAAHLQRKLGATCPSFDIAAACAGFLYGLDIASKYVETGTGPVLVVGVEHLSKVLDWEDRETCVLFGDGAGAAIVGSPAVVRGEGLVAKIVASTIATDGGHAELLQIPVEDGVVRMRGAEVFRLAVTELATACKQVLSQAGVAPEEVDHVVAHQANRRILEALARRVSIPWERFHITIDRFGNTSSASIPIGLDDALTSGEILAGERVLVAALGAGAAWGAALLEFGRRSQCS